MNLTTRVSVLGAAAMVLGASGCAAKSENYGCPTVDATGGAVIGDWNVTSACTAEYDRVTSGDWCSQLVFDANGVRQAYLGHPTLKFKSGKLSFIGNGSYTSELSFETLPGEARTTFPYSCLTAYGKEPSCGELTGALEGYLSDQGAAQQSYRLTPLQLIPFYPVGLVPQPSYSSIDCQDDGHNGCACSYTVGLVVPDRGQFASVGTTLTLYSETSALPYANDYSSDGASLAMTGRDGFDVMGQLGLRTLVFSK
jgi:hypothetical protein